MPEKLKNLESLYLQEQEKYLKEQHEKRERIDKRKANSTNNNGFMFVDTDIGSRNHMQIVFKLDGYSKCVVGDEIK